MEFTKLKGGEYTLKEKNRSCRLRPGYQSD
ncbi:hypothetical protein ACFSQ7_41890 [Paenibacillus rhizoplanae]